MSAILEIGMGTRDFLLLVVILFLSLIGSLFIIRDQGSRLQLLLFLGFIMVTVIVLAGVYLEELWAWRIGMLLFAAIIADLVFVMKRGESLLWFNVSLISSGVGLIFSLYQVRSYSPPREEVREVMPGPPIIEVPKPTEEAVAEIRARKAPKKSAPKKQTAKKRPAKKPVKKKAQKKAKRR